MHHKIDKHSLQSIVASLQLGQVKYRQVLLVVREMVVDRPDDLLPKKRQLLIELIVTFCKIDEHKYTERSQTLSARLTSTSTPRDHKQLQD